MDEHNKQAALLAMIGVKAAKMAEIGASGGARRLMSVGVTLADDTATAAAIFEAVADAIAAQEPSA